jgi:hypothetical protein
MEDHSTYSLSDIPASPSARSRFDLATTAAGWSASSSMVTAYSQLLAERVESSERFRAEVVEVKLAAAAVAENGSYVEVPRGRIASSPTLTNVRPTKLGGTKLRGAQLLDALFAGEPDGWGTATDKQVFTALVEAAGASGLQGDSLRQLNIVTALAVCVRAGIGDLHPSDLPNVGTPN